MKALSAFARALLIAALVVTPATLTPARARALHISRGARSRVLSNRKDGETESPVARTDYNEIALRGFGFGAVRPRVIGRMTNGAVHRYGSDKSFEEDVRRLTLAALKNLPAPDHVKDEIREELLQAMRAEAEAYRPELGRFSTHMTIRARYRATDLLRLRSREHAHRATMQDAFTVDELGVRELGFSEVELWDAIDRALSEEQQKLLSLLMSGRSQRSIAKELGVPPQTLSDRIKRLKAVLVTALRAVDLS